MSIFCEIKNWNIEIKGGIGSYLVFSGADYATVKEISNIVGKRLLISHDNITEIENRYQELHPLSPDSIRTLEANHCVFLSKNRHPLIVKTTPFYQHFRFHSATKKGACDIVKRRQHRKVEFVKIGEIPEKIPTHSTTKDHDPVFH